MLARFARSTAALREAVFSRWEARRWRTALGRARNGAHPEAALRVDDPEAIERHGSRGACPCRGPWHEVDRASIVYDGQPMIVATRRCALCATETTLYYRVGD